MMSDSEAVLAALLRALLDGLLFSERPLGLAMGATLGAMRGVALTADLIAGFLLLVVAFALIVLEGRLALRLELALETGLPCFLGGAFLLVLATETPTPFVIHQRNSAI